MDRGGHDEWQRLDALARAWGVALPNKEVVRELTRAEEGIGSRGYLRDEARWTREFARQLQTQFAAGGVEKRYVARIQGVPACKRGPF